MQSFDRKKDELLVWYASFGSNMDPERFDCYIKGGTPLGANRATTGCEDKTPPRKITNVGLPFQLYFAGESLTWTGGVCFLDVSVAERTKAKAYLITKGQYEHVSAQESGRGRIEPINMRALKEQGYFDLGVGRYDRIIYCGEHKGYPLLTFTSPIPIRPINKPAQAYVQRITFGLHGAYRMTTDDIVAYLIAKPGIAGKYSKPTLRAVVDNVLTRQP